MTNFNVSITARYFDQATAGVRATLAGLQAIKQTVTELNRAPAASGMMAQFGRLHGQMRGLVGEVRNLSREFSNLGRAMTTGGSGGSFAQQQIASLRTMLQLQQQIIANNSRMLTGPGGGGRGIGTGSGGGGGLFGNRSGFHPNASPIDRLQYRGANIIERSIADGALTADAVTTRFNYLRLPPEIQAQAHQMATALAGRFTALSRQEMLDTFGEIVTQFGTESDALRFLPSLLEIQQIGVMGGQTVAQSRSGMLALVRAIGLSGRLTGTEGELTMPQAQAFLNAYARAQAVHGRDFNADQAFQLIKYSRASGQTLSDEALYEAFIAAPDLRASSFGNAIDMLMRGWADGSATQASLQALIDGGLATRDAGGRYALNNVLDFRENMFAWFQTHVMGPQGYLARQGLDYRTASAAQLTEAMTRLSSNRSAGNVARQIVGQRPQWLNQMAWGNRLPIGGGTPEERAANDLARRQIEDQSLWVQLQSARSSLVDLVGTIAENFKSVLLPPIRTFGETLRGISRQLGPDGNQFAQFALYGGGLAGAFFILRTLARSMGGLGRMALGGGLGFSLGGLEMGIMGALAMRSLGAGGGIGAALGIGGAAGAAATAAGMGLGARIMAGIRTAFGFAGRFIRSSILIGVAVELLRNWETVAERLKAIWADLRHALPPFLGGQERAPGAMSGVSQLSEDFRRNITQPIEDWFLSTPMGQDALRRGMRTEYTGLASAFGTGMYNPGAHPATLDPGHGRGVAQGIAAAIGPMLAAASRNIAVTVTVYVNQTNADPAAIGAAAGSAVGSEVRRLLADFPDGPR